MKIKNLILIALLFLIFSIMSTTNFAHAMTTLTSPQNLTGNWQGNAVIIVSWCEQDSLLISIQIFRDGKVTGTVGDATLKNGQLKKNRGWLGKLLHIKSYFIIIADLQGPIVAKESISRKSVKIIFDLKDNKIEGGLHTSGAKIAGKKSMTLSATGMILEKQ